MNFDKVNEIVNKIPFGLITVCALGYFGFDYYTFTNDAQSPLIVKQHEIENIKGNNKKLEAKLKQLKDFVSTLDVKRNEIRGMAQDLQRLKGSLPERFDVPSFMKLVLAEAKSSGLGIESLTPSGETPREYYSEFAFNMNFRGIFSQLLIFFERISNIAQIVKIEKFNVRPSGTVQSKYIELEGDIELKTYKYLGSKADMLGTSTQASTLKSGAQSTGAAVGNANSGGQP